VRALESAAIGGHDQPIVDLRDREHPFAGTERDSRIAVDVGEDRPDPRSEHSVEGVVLHLEHGHPDAGFAGGRCHLAADEAAAEDQQLLAGTKAVGEPIRVRAMAREPFSYLTTHVPGTIGRTFSRAELASQPMLKLLERAGVKVDHASQRIGAGLATPAVAKALRVKTGSPLIELQRIVFDRSGKGVEHLHALYRPDRYSIAIDLVRSGSADRGGWEPATSRRERGKRGTLIN